MPFKSNKQEKFMFSQHPDIASKWASEDLKTPKTHSFDRLHSYFEGGKVKEESADEILADPQKMKALAEVMFENRRLETNLNPNITPKFSEESPDHSLEADPAMYPEGKIPAGRYQHGGQVPGEPKVHHNSPENDTVDAKLTPKEVVLPLDVTEAEDAPEEAKKFMKLHHYFGGKR